MAITKQQRRLNKGWNHHISMQRYISIREHLETEYKAYVERTKRLGISAIPYQEWLEL